MSQSLSSGAVTAAISGSVTTSSPTYPPGAVQKAGANTAVGVQNSTVYTVTAGKVLYITSVSLSGACSAAAQAPSISLQFDDGTSFQNLCGIKLQGSTLNATNSSTGIAFTIPVQVAATKTVRVSCDNASGTSVGSIIGYEL